MAEILDAKGTFQALKKMLSESQQYFYLVSPYINLDRKLFSIVSNYNHDITVICGKDRKKLNYIIDDFIDSRVLYCDNLHSKIYLTEKKAIVSTMNFYEYSVKNNYEISVLFDRSKYPEQWSKIYQQIDVYKKNGSWEW